MELMSDRVRAKLELLAQRFEESLPERLLSLRTVAGQVSGKKTDSEEAIILRNQAHKLAGSGATFGYEGISGLAKKLELFMDELIAAKLDLEKKQHAKILTIIDALESECSVRPEPNRVVSDAVDDRLKIEVAIEHEKRLIYFAAGDTHITEDFARQISFFGFPTRRCSVFSEVAVFDDEHDISIVVIDVRYLLENPTAASELKEIRSAGRNQVFLVLLSDSDDFDTRLFGVRIGGDAFFPTPVEVPRLVDAIDKITSEIDHSPYHVMIIDDDPEQLSYNALLLQNAGMITSVATDPRNVFKVLVESKPEIILMDLYMKHCDGRELALLIRQQEAFIGIPIVFLSIESDPEIQIESIKAGGEEFLTKPVKPEHLVASLEMRALRTRHIRFFMERDSLTGLLNHTHLVEGLQNEVRKAERVGNQLCFAMIDIDHFKNVNDTYGHLTGDRVLKSLARLLQDRLRKTDLIGRYGGEEFGVVFFNTTNTHAARILDEIRQSFGHIRHRAGNQDFYVTFSCGVAEYPASRTAAAISKAADIALYRAKETGRNVVVVG